MIPYALEFIDAKGRKWHPYEITFDSPDGKYNVHLYAISDEHAQLQLQALKETGRVSGQTLEVIKA